MKVRDAIKLIEDDGEATGSSSICESRGASPSPGNQSDDLAPGTFNSIVKQAGLKAEEK